MILAQPSELTETEREAFKMYTPRPLRTISIGLQYNTQFGLKAIETIPENYDEFELDFWAPDEDEVYSVLRKKAAWIKKDIDLLVKDLKDNYGYTDETLHDTLDVMGDTYDELRSKLLSIKYFMEIGGASNNNVAKTNADIEWSLEYIDAVIDHYRDPLDDNKPKRALVSTHQVFFHPPDKNVTKEQQHESIVREGLGRLSGTIDELNKIYGQRGMAKKAVGKFDKAIIVIDTRGIEEFKTYIENNKHKLHKNIEIHYMDEVEAGIYEYSRLPWIDLVHEFNEHERLSKIIRGTLYSRYVGMKLELDAIKLFIDKGFKVLQSGRNAYFHGMYLTELDLVVEKDGKRFIVECKSSRQKLHYDEVLEDKIVYKLRKYKKAWRILSDSVSAGLGEKARDIIDGVIFYLDTGLQFLKGKAIPKDSNARKEYVERLRYLVGLRKFLINKEKDFPEKYGKPVKIAFVDDELKGIDKWVDGIKPDEKSEPAEDSSRDAKGDDLNLIRKGVSIKKINKSIEKDIISGWMIGFDPDIRAADIDRLFSVDAYHTARNLTDAFYFKDEDERNQVVKKLGRHLARMSIDEIEELKGNFKYLLTVAKEPIDENAFGEMAEKLRELKEKMKDPKREDVSQRRIAVSLNPGGIFARGALLAHSGVRTQEKEASIYIGNDFLNSIQNRRAPILKRSPRLLALAAVLEHENGDIERKEHDKDIPEDIFIDHVKPAWDDIRSYAVNPVIAFIRPYIRELLFSIPHTLAKVWRPRLAPLTFDSHKILLYEGPVTAGLISLFPILLYAEILQWPILLAQGLITLFSVVWGFIISSPHITDNADISKVVRGFEVFKDSLMQGFEYLPLNDELMKIINDNSSKINISFVADDNLLADYNRKSNTVKLNIGYIAGDIDDPNTRREKYLAATLNMISVSEKLLEKVEEVGIKVYSHNTLGNVDYFYSVRGLYIEDMALVRISDGSFAVVPESLITFEYHNDPETIEIINSLIEKGIDKEKAEDTVRTFRKNWSVGSTGNLADKGILLKIDSIFNDIADIYKINEDSSEFQIIFYHLMGHLIESDNIPGFINQVTYFIDVARINKGVRDFLKEVIRKDNPSQLMDYYSMILYFLNTSEAEARLDLDYKTFEKFSGVPYYTVYEVFSIINRFLIDPNDLAGEYGSSYESKERFDR
ncbi:hypothetical protein ACFLTD_04895, partial [Elusimicrobiota bacterium]